MVKIYSCCDSSTPVKCEDCDWEGRIKDCFHKCNENEYDAKLTARCSQCHSDNLMLVDLGG